jgi:PhnB protein
MRLTPYLFFNGDCEAALKFYEQCLGGKIDALMKYRGTPAEEHTPPEWHDKVMHGHLTFGDAALMASDVPPGHYKSPQGFHVALSAVNADEAGRVFAALAENGKVNMPLQKTFFAARYGDLVDQFGISWAIACEKAD